MRENIKIVFNRKITSVYNIDFCNIIINKVINNNVNVNKTNNFNKVVNDEKDKNNEIINTIIINFFDFLICFVRTCL